MYTPVTLAAVNIIINASNTTTTTTRAGVAVVVAAAGNPKYVPRVFKAW